MSSNQVSRILLAWLLTLWAAGRSQQACAIDVWITSGDKTQLLSQQRDLLWQNGQGSGGTPIGVSAATTYQTMVGFGAALTDSSAWLLQNKLSAPERDKLLRQFFSPTAGIGINYLRVPMGASDFTAGPWYTYNDNPSGGTDANQAQFSLAHDQAYILPQLQQAHALNPALKLMGSPWTAPAWMKTNNSLAGGSLSTQWEESWARYLVKFVEAYEAAGLPIDAITLQNEPLHTANYPTMSMSASQQARIIRQHLGPLLAEQELATKIFAYDHNWDNTAYPLSVLGDAAANPFVAGTAFHAYAGAVAAQTTVHDAYPEKSIYFTEITGGDWATNFGDNLVWNFQNIFIGGARNWSETALLWNLALDENGNPHLGGCNGCRGVVTVNSATGAVTFNEEFFALGQMTRGVEPGAVRVSSSSSTTIPNVAFLNPDGTRSIVALNPSSSPRTLRLFEGNKHVLVPLPGKSVATLVWQDGVGADFDNGAFDDGGFQAGGGSLDAWTPFGNVAGNVAASGAALLSGDKALRLAGQFTGANNVSGVFQGKDVAPGDRVGASAEALLRSVDGPLGGGNQALLKIEFYSQFGADRSSASFLGEAAAVLADAASGLDAWTRRELVATAPAGAVEARLVLLFEQTLDQPGAVFVDEAQLLALAAGDFDGSGAVDGDDLQAWRQRFGTDGAAWPDATGDDHVDGADLLIWQQRLGDSSPLISPPAPASHRVPECGVRAMACLSGAVMAAGQRACHSKQGGCRLRRFAPFCSRWR